MVCGLSSGSKLRHFGFGLNGFGVLCEEGGAGRVSNLGLGSSCLLGWAFPPIIGMFRASGVCGLEFNGLGV